MSQGRRWAVLALCCVTTACASRGLDEPPELLVGHATAAAMGYRVAWPVDLGLASGQSVLFAQVLGDKLVTFETGNIACVMDAATGRKLWRTGIGSPLERFSAPQRDGDRLVMCSETRAHLYDIQVGGLIDAVDLSAVSNTRPLIINGMMIHGSPKGIVYAQGLDNGLLFRSFEIGGAAAADPVQSGPLVAVASTERYVFGFDPTTMLPAWRAHTYGRISAPLAATDSTVFVACEDRSLYAFARAPGRPGTQGKQEWRYYTEDRLKTPPYVFGENVYQYVPSKGLVALDAATGNEKWVLKWRDARPFMLKNGRLYVLRRGRIAIVTPDDGLVLEQFNTPHVQTVVPQSPTGGDLYLVHLDGRILKLVSQ